VVQAGDSAASAGAGSIQPIGGRINRVGDGGLCGVAVEHNAPFLTGASVHDNVDAIAWHWWAQADWHCPDSQQSGAGDAGLLSSD